MSAPRAVWKGFLRLGNVTCSVKLTGAVTEAETIHFKILNRLTRQPVKAAYVDEVTEKTVEPDDQVKGYEVDRNEYLLLEPDEIAALKPLSEHIMTVDGFVDVAEVDPIYFDKPYYVSPADKASLEPFSLVREAMLKTKKVALASVVLWQRDRHVLLEPLGKGILLTILRNAKEIVPASKVFGQMEDVKIDPDMTEIASMLIDKKATHFDPSKFEDAYEDALRQLIESKRTGKPAPKPAPRPKENVKDLASILRKSLEAEGGEPPKGKKPKAKPES